jgi:hypothetical protein
VREEREEEEKLKTDFERKTKKSKWEFVWERKVGRRTTFEKYQF